MTELLCPSCQARARRKPLTKRQAEVLAFIEDGIHAHRYAPSYEEIAAHFGYRSLATVHEHLTNLQRKNWIVREYNEHRGIRLVEDAHA